MIIQEGRQLGILLLEDISFEQLVLKVEKAFGIYFSSYDDKGRYVAKGNLNDYSVEVVDKIDRLSEILCDDNYVINIKINSDRLFNAQFENNVKKLLKIGGIKWRDGIWTKIRKEENYRIIYP